MSPNPPIPAKYARFYSPEARAEYEASDQRERVAHSQRRVTRQLFIPQVGTVYNGFTIQNYLPGRNRAVVEAQCPRGHVCVTWLRGLWCQQCAEEYAAARAAKE